MKKFLTVFLSVVAVLSFACFFACSGNDGETDTPNTEIYAVYTVYKAYAEEKGDTPLSYEEWLESIKGKDGEDGVGILNILKVTTVENQDTYMIVFTNGNTFTYNITNGIDGNDGQDGEDGQDGVGVQNVIINENGDLIITLTSGDDINAGKVKDIHGHEIEEKEYIEREAGCTEIGIKYVFCSVCGELLKTVITEPTGHNYSEEYTYNENYHWHDVTCGHEDAVIKEEHSFDNNGICVVCGYHEGDFVDDHNKKQLYVSNFNGGYGDEWLKAVATRFEEANKDREFSDGEKGVQIIVGNTKVAGETLTATVLGSRNHVFITEGVMYNDYVDQGVVLDLTSAVTTPLTEYGETKSIEEKLTEGQQASMLRGGKYYMIPHYAGYNGITIDVDLFDAKSLFMSSTGAFNKKSTDTGLSKGPDNISGTYDDGLPATYEEFYALCRTMKTRGVTPISWSGQHQWYVSTMLAALCIDDMGLEEGTLQFTFNGGNTDIVTGFNNGSPVIENRAITTANGYDIFRQVGFYNSLSFIQKIVNEKWYTDNSFISGQSYIDVQKDFLMSSKDPSLRPIGMLIEGCWWESEATNTFNIMETQYQQAGKYDRRFRFIPFPKSSAEKVGTGATLVEANNCYSFIKANIEEIDGTEIKNLAIDFLRFMNTDESLREFSRITNTAKALKYEMTEDDLDSLTYFGRSLFEIKNAPTTNILYPPLSETYSKNYRRFQFANRLSYGTYTYPTTAFKDDENLTAAAYFTGLANNWQNLWRWII